MVSARFFHCKLFSPFCALEVSHSFSPYSVREGEEGLSPRGGSLDRYYLEFFYKENLSLLPIYYSIIYQYELVYFFYTLGYNLILSLLLKLFVWPQGALSDWLLCPSDMSHLLLPHPCSMSAFDIKFGFLTPSTEIALRFFTLWWFLDCQAKVSFSVYFTRPFCDNTINLFPSNSISFSKNLLWNSQT